MKFAKSSGDTPPRNARVAEGVWKSVFFANLILFLHLVVVLGLGLAMIFFHGMVLYLPWIFTGTLLLLGLTAYLLHRRAKRQGRTLGQLWKQPLLQGRPVEVSVLGGLACLRVGAGRPEVPHPRLEALEDPWAIRARELAELARLLEENLITEEEYQQARRGILSS
ncbi:MAG: SHOCT domain-containing protein [Deltaproteobacteria bacterium]|nr:SHOCT domain-containing protein [Deltaproteobacteria bacterium]